MKLKALVNELWAEREYLLGVLEDAKKDGVKADRAIVARLAEVEGRLKAATTFEPGALRRDSKLL